MPSYFNADGKVVVAFKNSGKFNTRYSTLEFQDAANLDDGDLWPMSFALQSGAPQSSRELSSWCRPAECFQEAREQPPEASDD
jgi:uncharacterized protein YdhG (YjbR/CyaY superfamily)